MPRRSAGRASADLQALDAVTSRLLIAEQTMAQCKAAAAAAEDLLVAIRGNLADLGARLAMDAQEEINTDGTSSDGTGDGQGGHRIGS